MNALKNAWENLVLARKRQGIKLSKLFHFKMSNSDHQLGCQILLEDVPDFFTIKDLKEYFSQFGKVNEIVESPTINNNLQSYIINFSNKETGQKALNAGDEQYLLGYKIKLKLIETELKIIQITPLIQTLKTKANQKNAELVRIQIEFEENKRKQKEDQDKLKNHEQNEERLKREVQQVREQMKQIEDKLQKYEEEKLRISQIEKEKLQIEEDEQKKKQIRDKQKIHKKQIEQVFPKDSILYDSSFFNGQQFPRWKDDKHSINPSPLQNIPFSSPIEYPCNNIRQQLFSKLLRPKQIFSDKKDEIVMYQKSDRCESQLLQKDRWNCIQQGYVKDCPLISAIIAMTFMEDKINQPLVYDKIYPRNPNNIGIYNANGQYHLRLFFNGDYRMIEIDDLLPCIPESISFTQQSQQIQIASGRSTLTGELWASILEKGYLRLFSGYDSISQNFSQIVFAFCQWIPDPSFKLSNIYQHDYEYQKLMKRIQSGDVLVEVVISKDQLTQSQEKKLGLHTNHSYALLDAIQMFGVGSTVHGIKKVGPPQLQEVTGFIPVESEEQCEKDGTFYIELSEIQKYFNNENLCWNPQLLPFRQEVHFAYKELYYKIEDKTVRNRFCPQFLMFKSSKEQKIWLLLNKHYQGKSYSIFDAKKEDEKLYFIVSICTHDNPQEIPYFQRVSHRLGNKVFSYYHSQQCFNLVKIGLFDEEIHQTSIDEQELDTVQFDFAMLHYFMKDYVGWFTVRIEIDQAPKIQKNDLRFSLFAYSDCEMQPIIRIKQHHQDEINIDTHWQPLPMMEFYSGLRKTEISFKTQENEQSHFLLINNSVNIKAGDRSWQDDKGDNIISMLFRALGGLDVVMKFIKIIHFILGTQIDLILTPREGEIKYGQQMQISAIWDSEINGGIDGGIHINEIEHAHGLENLLPNIGVGGISKVQLYNENCINKGMAQRKYILQSEKVEGREQVVVKKRALRIIPFCQPTFLGRRDAFTLESIGPEGYDVKYIQRKGPWQYSTRELAWTDKIFVKSGQMFEIGQRMKQFYIIKADKATNLHLQFIMLQFSKLNLLPQVEFNVVKLKAELINEEMISVRLTSACERGEWNSQDQVLFIHDKETSQEVPFANQSLSVDEQYNNGLVITSSGCGRIDDCCAYYGLCVSARLYEIDQELVMTGFAWSDSELHLYELE
ncbi:MAG: putative cysteine proteinase [Streblomastix strix]|uniref:Putative cysteine proteinase n=1 Tax=Streblomastix strix TaxID=222440 RepID=A0A5J4VY00_9EUKA|nr:MAG: putative cysteine proteinase [Streblomastix strix]